MTAPSTDRSLKRADCPPTLRVPFSEAAVPDDRRRRARGAARTGRAPRSRDGAPAVARARSRATYFELEAHDHRADLLAGLPDAGQRLRGEAEARRSSRTSTVDRDVAIRRLRPHRATDSHRYIVGGTTSVNYGMTNRLMAKRKATGGSERSPRDPHASSHLADATTRTRRPAIYDPARTSRLNRRADRHYAAVRSPWARRRRRPIGSARSFRIEYDAQFHGDPDAERVDDAPYRRAAALVDGLVQARLHPGLPGLSTRQRDRILNGATRSIRTDEPCRRRVSVQLGLCATDRSCSSASWRTTTASAAGRVDYQTSTSDAAHRHRHARPPVQLLLHPGRPGFLL